MMQMLFILLMLGSLLQCYGVSDNLLYPYGPPNGDLPGPVTGEITLFQVRKKFTFYEERYKKLYICSNGLISLGESYCADNPVPFADGHTIMAPFWVKQNTSPDGTQVAKIWYRVTSEAAILDRAAADIDGFFEGCKPADFKPKHVIIVTWEDVKEVDACVTSGKSEAMCDCLFNPPEFLDRELIPRYCDCVMEGHEPLYCECVAMATDSMECQHTPRDPAGHSINKRDVATDTNTYQIVIAYDKLNTFVSLHYDHLSWISDKEFITGDGSDEFPINHFAMAGFVNKERSFYTLPNSESVGLYNLTTSSNIGMNGRHMYMASSSDILDPECHTMNSLEGFDEAPLLYPFGPRHGDRSGPTVGHAHLQFDDGIKYFDTMYQDVWASSEGSLSFSETSPPDMDYNDQPEIRAFNSRQYLRHSYQVDRFYYEYDYMDDTEIMLSSRFWYRVTSDPVILARAQSDVRANAGAELCFQPTSVAVVTWYKAQSVDYCARHGFSDDLCYCMFVFNVDNFCPCLVEELKENYEEFYYNYEQAEGGCNYISYAERRENTQLFVPNGPWTDENTYQAVLITDGSSTYLLLHYPEISWVRSNYYYRGGTRYPVRYYAKVGIDNGGSSDSTTNYVHPFSESDLLFSLSNSSNVDIPGKYIYKINGPTIWMPWANLGGD